MAASRHFLSLVLAACCAASVSPARAFDLATEAEVRADLSAPEAPQSRDFPNPDAPVIELLAPSIDKPVTSPMDIRLRWKAAAGSAIDPASARVLYGRLHLNVTSRVLAAAKVSDLGIDAPGAKLPAGEHRLTIEVSDTQGRTGEHEFLVEVAR